MKRDIVKIDEALCTGCGLCIPNCPEGAIQLIDGKARLVGDLFCDGLGACLGNCPEDAITVETREAEPYDERRVMANVTAQGPNVVRAHLRHLRDHGQDEYYAAAVAFLNEKGMADPLQAEEAQEAGRTPAVPSACPGSLSRKFGAAAPEAEVEGGARRSRLTHWPIQLHLMSPAAPQYKDSDVLLAADCVAYACGDFHKDWLQGKTLAIACPKLDAGQDVYEEKIRALIDDAQIRSLTIMIMEVPCCRGLVALARRAAERAHRKIQVQVIVVGLQGAVGDPERL